ncbi:MAG TPA: hypothetical protein ENN77_02815 [Candidatus Wirthbacteria bacterium]|nr:hypothetical protein [Candidatus Wirthbacteria bacterium]
MTKEDILAYLSANKSFLMNEYHLTKIGLFGSFARQSANQGSDIDLIIELKPGVSDIFETKLRLKQKLQKDLNRDIDICREKYLKPYAREAVLQDTIYV